MMIKACKDLPTIYNVDSHKFIDMKWADNTLITSIKEKNMYNVLSSNNNIISHVDNFWYTDLDDNDWNKFFKFFGRTLLTPKSTISNGL